MGGLALPQLLQAEAASGKQRLMTASYDYFELRYPNEGLRGGFIYKSVPHVTLKSIARNASML